MLQNCLITGLHNTVHRKLADFGARLCHVMLLFLHQALTYFIMLSPLYFLGGGAAMVIAWATVLVQAKRVANNNSVGALRYE